MHYLQCLVGGVFVLVTTTAGDNGVQGFWCANAVPSKTIPDSVHALRPGDIKVVAAFGDSLTAGNGAGGTNYLDVFKQYRGMSFSIGGDGNLGSMVTVPNILKTFTHVIGASHGVCAVTDVANSRFNVAVPGSKIKDLPKQAVDLVQRIKSETDVNFDNDWKLVSLLIGTNNLCQDCQGSEEEPSVTSTTRRPWWGRTTTNGPKPSAQPTPSPPSNRIQPLKDALAYLHTNLPRTLVNVINVNRVDQLATTHNQSVMCLYFHKFMCPCLLRPDFALQEAKLQADILAAAEDASLHDREDFTVAVQPMVEHYVFPKTSQGVVDLKFLAPDCFHWSEMGHARMAAALWNNILSPVGAKTTADTTKIAHLSCPDDSCPFIRTYSNSRQCSILTP